MVPDATYQVSLVPGNKIFKGFIKHGHGGHPGHVTNIILIKFHFHVPKSLHIKLAENGPVVSEKRKL